MKEECRMQVADLVEEARADINVDPLLQKACAIDVNKYCSHVAQGAGRRKLTFSAPQFSNIYLIIIKIVSFSDIKCLQDNKDSLQLDCYKMLTTRMEMFKNAAKVSRIKNCIRNFEEIVFCVKNNVAFSSF